MTCTPQRRSAPVAGALGLVAAALALAALIGCEARRPPAPGVDVARRVVGGLDHHVTAAYWAPDNGS
jgi:hypothetical protein